MRNVNSERMSTPTFRAWLKQFERADNRLGDAAREIATDPEFPRGRPTAQNIEEWCDEVGACTSYTENVLDAFAAYMEDEAAT